VIVYCPACGFRNSEGASFCARCGASLLVEQAEQDEAQTTISYVPGEEEPVAPHAHDLLPEGPSLVIRSGGGRAGETYALTSARTTIGRHPDSTIFLDDVTVSRNHAVVERDGAACFITDQGSLNGTYVNRHRVERQLLTDGDELQIGKYKLTFITQ
jgi:hypothetical protein